MKQEFNLGDRVVVFNSDNTDLNLPVNGDIGIVCVLPRPAIGIDFERKIPHGHSCEERAKEGHGYYLSVRRVRHYNTKRILSIFDWKNKK